MGFCAQENWGTENRQREKTIIRTFYLNSDVLGLGFLFFSKQILEHNSHQIFKAI